MSQKPSILLTGGSGLLAVNWFYSKRSDYNVYLGLNERHIQPLGGHILSLDYTSEQSLLLQLESIAPSVVIHTAGLTNVEKIIDPLIYRPYDIQYQWGDISELLEITDWKQTYTIDQTIQDLLNYWVKKLS